MILCGFHIMHLNSVYLPIPLIRPLSLQPDPWNKTKFKRKINLPKTQTKNKQTNKHEKKEEKSKKDRKRRKRTSLWSLWCGSTLQSLIFIYRYSLPGIIGLVTDLFCCCCIDNGLSPDCPGDFLQLSCVLEILEFWLCSFLPFSCSNCSEMS